MSAPKIKRALLSVSNKEALIPFAKGLVALGIELVSTGGTYYLLKDHVPVQEVSSLTQFPEMMEGRVKTLHPKIHGGILAKRDQHQTEIQQHAIPLIDLVICNLYPFAETIAKENVDIATAYEQIDVGGPTMVRAAAKNYLWVGIVIDPQDYPAILKELQTNQGILSKETRFALSAKAFQHTATYDATIAHYLASSLNPHEQAFPETLQLSLTKKQLLRYGENPHQSAALYTFNSPTSHSIVEANILQGKTLSFNNLVDADNAWMCAQQFEAPSCVIVKHANPCGVASNATLLEAYRLAFNSDPQSAFGGVIAFNRALDPSVLTAILENQFVEVIIAPEIPEATVRLAAEKPNLRLLAAGCSKALTTSTFARFDYKRLYGGLLVQTADEGTIDTTYEVVTEKAPTKEEWLSLKFAYQVCRYVKSNAIVLSQGTQTIGIGAGQTSRIFALSIALERAKMAGFSTKGAVLASDAFFPFTDSIELAQAANISAIIQPGGSVRDQEIIAKANALNIAMLFTGFRHFRH